MKSTIGIKEIYIRFGGAEMLYAESSFLRAYLLTII